MYKEEQVTYHIPINPTALGGTQTVAIITINSSSYGRCALMTRWLKHTFAMTRKQARLAIRELGFDDLIPCANLNTAK